MDPEFPTARVPVRTVILSILGVWSCYFVLVTVRGAIVGFELDWPFLSRRIAVTLLSMAITGALWLMLRVLDARPLWVKATAILIGALPASMLIGAFNQWAFAGIQSEIDSKVGVDKGIRIRRDEAGNVLVDLVPPAPPPPPASTNTNQRSGQSPTLSRSGSAPAPANSSDAGVDGGLEQLSDIATGRYFLLLAWAALYLALVNGEQLRAAERREGEYRRAAEASELRSLRYQVNPHFLFNTLNSLSALVLTGKLAAAEEMIQTLSTFYRRTLSGDPTDDLPLAGEIELQQLYLDIEAVRFPHRLLRVVELPEALAGAMVPGMILQPIVENSVKYAVAASSDPVCVRMTAAEEFGRLVITISDDGKGGGRAPTESCGIGLQNVRDRLDARFGREASLDAGPLAGGGFRTMIRMPLVRRDD